MRVGIGLGALDGALVGIGAGAVDGASVCVGFRVGDATGMFIGGTLGAATDAVGVKLVVETSVGLSWGDNDGIGIG